MNFRLPTFPPPVLTWDQPLGLMSQSGAIKVTEITKLVEDKQGGGVRVPVETFEGNNLIFVDEGHKGAGGEAWRGMRDALAETGFTFEYSATFGQALAAANNDALLTEYGKSPSHSTIPTAISTTMVTARTFVSLTYNRRQPRNTRTRY